MVSSGCSLCSEARAQRTSGEEACVPVSRVPRPSPQLALAAQGCRAGLARAETRRGRQGDRGSAGVSRRLGTEADGGPPSAAAEGRGGHQLGLRTGAGPTARGREGPGLGGAARPAATPAAGPGQPRPHTLTPGASVCCHDNSRHPSPGRPRLQGVTESQFAATGTELCHTVATRGCLDLILNYM